ncbi:BCCT family transporter, partial [Corynebacterium bovis]
MAGSMRGRGTVDAPATNWPVFIISGLGVLAVAAYAFFGRASAERTLGDITGWISTNLGWFYIFTATVAVVFMIGV